MSHLTDEDLWRAIAENTNAMSKLVEQQLALDAGLGESNADARAKLMASNEQSIDKYHHEYRDLTAELCRRYPAAA